MKAGKKWYPRGERLIVRFDDYEEYEPVTVAVHGRAEAEAMARDAVLPQVKEIVEVLRAAEEASEDVNQWDLENLEIVLATMEATGVSPGEFDSALETWNTLVGSNYGNTKVEIL